MDICVSSGLTVDTRITRICAFRTESAAKAIGDASAGYRQPEVDCVGVSNRSLAQFDKSIRLDKSVSQETKLGQNRVAATTSSFGLAKSRRRVARWTETERNTYNL